MTLRSQATQGLRQERWTRLVKDKLLRLEMTRLAAKARGEPVRLSFTAAPQH